MWPPFSRTYAELLREHAGRAPERPFLVTPQSSTSYAEFDKSATRLASALLAFGIKRGKHVALLAPNGSEWLEVFFACASVGATVVPLSTWSTPREIAQILNDAKPSLMFTAHYFGARDFAHELAELKLEGNVDNFPTVFVLGGTATDSWPSWRELLAERAPQDPLALPPGERVSATDPVALLYTSGSSAHPKAVPLLHAHAIENAYNIGRRQHYNYADRVLVPVPLFWSYGAANALPAILSHGATLVTLPQFEPDVALDLLEQQRCTAIYTLPAITNALLSCPGFASKRTSTLRTGLTIGAPQDVRRAADALGAAEICNIYGSTETYGNCAVTEASWPLEKRAQCQGKPLPGVALRVRDENSKALLPNGEVGALEVRGYLTPGYAGVSGEHNATSFTTDGWFVTGDLAMLNADGTVSYQGRQSEMIKRSGINVSPAEVEEVLQLLPQVGLAGVTGLTDTERGQLIIAFVVLRPGTNSDTSEILTHCKTHLSRYKVPDQLHVVESLPLTPTGKLLRKSLPSLIPVTKT